MSEPTIYNEIALKIKGQQKEVEKLRKENYKLKNIIKESIEYINHAQNYGLTAQVMPHLKSYVNGDDLLNILEGNDDNNRK